MLKYVECRDCTSGFGMKLFNLLFPIVYHGQLLVSPLCSLSSNMRRCWLFDGLWLTDEEEGMVALPFVACCYLIGICDPPWPYGGEDCSHFWIWPAQHNLAALLFQRKIIVSSRLGPAKDAIERQLRAGWGGWGDAIRKRQVEGLPPVAILLLLNTFKRMIFSLFSPNSFEFWPS